MCAKVLVSIFRVSNVTNLPWVKFYFMHISQDNFFTFNIRKNLSFPDYRGFPVPADKN